MITVTWEGLSSQELSITKIDSNDQVEWTTTVCKGAEYVRYGGDEIKITSVTPHRITYRHTNDRINGNTGRIGWDYPDELAYEIERGYVVPKE